MQRHAAQARRRGRAAGSRRNRIYRSGSKWTRSELASGTVGPGAAVALRLRPNGRSGVRLDPFAERSANDGVDGGPNGISVLRWSLSKPHLKGSLPWASLSGIVDSHAGWSRSCEEGVSGSRSRREGLDRCGAQPHAQPAHPVLRRAAAVRGGDGGVIFSASLGAGADRTRARGSIAAARACEAGC
jgi:hypothetical protein